MTRIIAPTVRFAVAQLRESFPDIHPVVVKILLDDPTPQKTLSKLSLDYLVLHKGVECQILNLLATLVHQPHGYEATRIVASLLRELGHTPVLPDDQMWMRFISPENGPWPWFLQTKNVQKNFGNYETQDREFSLWDVWVSGNTETGLVFHVHGIPGLNTASSPEAKNSADIMRTYFKEGIDAAKTLFEEKQKFYKGMPSPIGGLGMSYALWCESTWVQGDHITKRDWLDVEMTKMNLQATP